MPAVTVAWGWALQPFCDLYSSVFYFVLTLPSTSTDRLCDGVSGSLTRRRGEALASNCGQVGGENSSEKMSDMSDEHNRKGVGSLSRRFNLNCVKFNFNRRMMGGSIIRD